MAAVIFDVSETSPAANESVPGRRLRDGDPIVSIWRSLGVARGPILFTERLTLLALQLPPYDGAVAPRGGVLPPGLLERIQLLLQYLIEVGELSEADAEREIERGWEVDVEPFVDELRAGLVAGDEALGSPTDHATIVPVVDELCERAWAIVGRELPDTLWDQIRHAVLLLFLACFPSSSDLPRDHRRYLLDAFRERLCGWLVEHRGEALTAADGDELASQWKGPAASA
jgi:hypothetical protein